MGLGHKIHRELVVQAQHQQFLAHLHLMQAVAGVLGFKRPRQEMEMALGLLEAQAVARAVLEYRARVIMQLQILALVAAAQEQRQVATAAPAS